MKAFGRFATIAAALALIPGAAATASATIPPTKPLAWVAQPQLPTPRGGLASAVLDGRIYALGGLTSGEASTLNTADVFDPLDKRWRPIAGMPTSRGFLGAASIDGQIYAVGGRDDAGRALATVESFSPRTDTWTTDAPLPAATDFEAVTAGSGRLFAVGGVDGKGKSLASLEIYNPITNRWTQGRSMPTAHGPAGVAWSGNRLYAIGGFGKNGAVGNVDAYDPLNNTWKVKTSIPTPRSHPAVATLAGGQIMVAGGGPKPGTAIVEVYTPSSNTWTQLPALPVAVIPTGAVVGDDFYAIGGFAGPRPDATGSVEAIDVSPAVLRHSLSPSDPSQVHHRSVYRLTTGAPMTPARDDEGNSAPAIETILAENFALAASDLVRNEPLSVQLAKVKVYVSPSCASSLALHPAPYLPPISFKGRIESAQYSPPIPDITATFVVYVTGSTKSDSAALRSVTGMPDLSLEIGVGQVNGKLLVVATGSTTSNLFGIGSCDD